MAQPNGDFLPYQFNEPFDNLQSVEHFLMNNGNDYPELDFTELPSHLQDNDFSINPPPMMLQSSAEAETAHLSDQSIDPFIVDNEIFVEGVQTGTDNTNRSNEFGNPIQLSDWPLQLPPYTCSCCQILREITHTNGVEITKLEVHGRLGVICHGVLEKYNVDLAPNQCHEYKMFDFCKESISKVKEFLMDYCKERKTSGFVMLQDPLSGFYEAICVGLDWVDGIDTDGLILDDSGDQQTNHPVTESSRTRNVNQTAFSAQRERTGKLTIKDLVDYFNIPIEVTAKKIQVCPTVIKKICRKHGLSRWPYRKIKSIERKISTREKCLSSVDAVERCRAQADIDKFRQEIVNIYARFNV